MTEFNTQNNTDGSESVTVTWTLDDASDQHTGDDGYHSCHFVAAETKPNGDPPSMIFGGNDDD